MLLLVSSWIFNDSRGVILAFFTSETGVLAKCRLSNFGVEIKRVKKLVVLLLNKTAVPLNGRFLFPYNFFDGKLKSEKFRLREFFFTCGFSRSFFGLEYFSG